MDCKQTLPRSKVDHLDTNHRMQKYGGKTDNQDTKRRVWTRQTLPRSRVGHLDTNHRMQKYGENKQITKIQGGECVL